MRYQGFISYSHAGDGKLAPAIHNALHRIAKPWYRAVVSYAAFQMQRHLWRADDLIAEACTRLDRNLTAAEWRQYLGDEPYRKTCPGK